MVALTHPISEQQESEEGREEADGKGPWRDSRQGSRRQVSPRVEATSSEASTAVSGGGSPN